MFNIQLFAYDTSDLVTVGQIKKLTERIVLRLVALENTTIKSLKVEDNKVKFYACLKKDIKNDTVPVDSYDLPEEIFLDQAGTDIVENFAWTAAKYPGSTNPNLDGKTVFVLAVKGDKSTDPTIKYDFVNMTSLVDAFIPKDTLAGAGNLATWQSDGTITDSSIASAGVFTTISGAVKDNVMIFAANNGKVADSGHAIATDAEFTDFLNEVLPTVTSGGGDDTQEGGGGGEG